MPRSRAYGRLGGSSPGCECRLAGRFAYCTPGRLRLFDLLMMLACGLLLFSRLHVLCAAALLASVSAPPASSGITWSTTNDSLCGYFKL